MALLALSTKCPSVNLKLLFADDMVILRKSADAVQSHVDNLNLYCYSCGHSVNTAKTKIVVFRKKGIVKENEKRTYNV